MMAVPGLPLFYGGMVRAKNMLSVMMQCMLTFALLGVLWCVYGYSLAFTEGNAFIGGLSKLFLQGVTVDSVAATFTKGVAIPEFLYIAFQMTFAAITPALIIGAFAERMKFSAVMLFVLLWVAIIYFPVAHWVWGVADPNALVDAATLMKEAAPTEPLAWQDLAALWQFELKAGDPCNQLYRARLVCHSGHGFGKQRS